MFYVAAVLIFAIGIGCGTYLVVSGHPWFALLVFMLTASIRLKQKKAPDTLTDRHGEPYDHEVIEVPIRKKVGR